MTAPTSAPDGNHTFDWHGTEDDGSIVIRNQMAIAVYLNPRGAVVIRQQGEWDRDGDMFVVVEPANLRTLVGELIELCKYLEEK
jgi:hypothetical protein